MDVLSKRFGDAFDLEYGLEADLRRQLEYILSAKAKLPEYYIWIVAKQVAPGVIHTCIRTTLRQPPKVLNSICYHVNNRFGLLKQLWVAPLDLPVPDSLILPESQAISIIDQTQDLPVINA
ncbi:MAG: hypothetical protein PHZ19_08165 [Candidatus Thermoplasmatota archaeon]|nr:hypothetical protein [Candidatus Thermoplasmatota archaeon]